MWIRSQDKMGLRNYDGIGISYHNKKQIYGDAKFSEEDSESYYVLGEYETEERALQVLDQIQNQLIEGVKHDDIIKGRRHQRNFVFQMPQK